MSGEKVIVGEFSKPTDLDLIAGASEGDYLKINRIAIPKDRRENLEARQKFKELYTPLHFLLELFNKHTVDFGDNIRGMNLFDFARLYGDEWVEKIFKAPFCDIEKTENHKIVKVVVLVGCVDEEYTIEAINIIKRMFGEDVIVYFLGSPGNNIRHNDSESQNIFENSVVDHAIEVNADAIVFVPHPDCAAAGGDDIKANEQSIRLSQEVTEIIEFRNSNQSVGSTTSNEAGPVAYLEGVQSICLSINEVERVSRSFHHQAWTVVDYLSGFKAHKFNEMTNLPTMHKAVNTKVGQLVDNLFLSLKINAGNHGLNLKPYTFSFIVNKKPDFNPTITQLQKDILHHNHHDSVFSHSTRLNEMANEGNIELVIRELREKIIRELPEYSNCCNFTILYAND